MDNKEIEIFVVTHKEFKEPKIDSYVPIQVGYDENLNYIRDNTKDNIANKNKKYCELTAIYWIWKNIKTKIVGITHYRRFFSSNVFYPKIISAKKVKKILQKYDIILPVPTYLKKGNVQEQYCEKHYFKDLKLCREIIKEKYNNYVKDFDIVMQRRYFYTCNMCITRKDIFDEYAKWLFEILFEMEKRNNISNYSEYNQRIYGFLSERLLNVWLLHNKELKIKELPVFNSESKKRELLIWNMKNKIKKAISKSKQNFKKTID